MTQFRADVVLDAESITRLTDALAEFLSKAGVDARAVHHVALVVDEILTNVATHGGGGGEAATITMDVEPDRVTGTIIDSGAPFDPRTAPMPDLTAPIEDRRIGGVGLHLVRELTSALDYRHDGRQNWTTFCFLRAVQRSDQDQERPGAPIQGYRNGIE